MGQFKHPCIKCHSPYESDDLDAYYCPTCLEERKKVVEKLESQFSNLPKKEVVSDLQAFEATARKYKTVDGREILFGKYEKS